MYTVQTNLYVYLIKARTVHIASVIEKEKGNKNYNMISVWNKSNMSVAQLI